MNELKIGMSNGRAAVIPSLFSAATPHTHHSSDIPFLPHSKKYPLDAILGFTFFLLSAGFHVVHFPTHSPFVMVMVIVFLAVTVIIVCLLYYCARNGLNLLADLVGRPTWTRDREGQARQTERKRVASILSLHGDEDEKKNA
ncbi:MAG: hypothetical protein JOS17DRAFT_556099 [Linnemannia elongata]|nr:MAG: hypothetical protein JOS17DRAFT_556099 [Linnemannia elongata]